MIGAFVHLLSNVTMLQYLCPKMDFGKVHFDRNCCFKVMRLYSLEVVVSRQIPQGAKVMNTSSSKGRRYAQYVHTFPKVLRNTIAYYNFRGIYISALK